jgi:hypothetical protein
MSVVGNHVCCEGISSYLKMELSTDPCWGLTLSKQDEGTDEIFKDLLQTTGRVFEKVVSEFLNNGNHIDKQRKLKKTVSSFFEKYHVSNEDSTNSPLIRVVTTVYSLGFTHVHTLSLMEKLLKIFFSQHFDDLPKYVSHGFNHSINVAYHCEQLFLSKGSEEITRINNFFKSKYPYIYEKDSSEKAIALIKLHAYLHDCGYPSLYGMEKANHSFLSACKVDEIREDLRGILGIDDNFDNLFDDFRHAIFFHNADTGNVNFRHKVKTGLGNFLAKGENKDRVVESFQKKLKFSEVNVEDLSDDVQGRVLDLDVAKDNLMGLEKKIGILAKNPFHLIRIGDNLDFVRSRMTEAQQQPDFIKVCKDLFELRDKEQSKLLSSTVEIWDKLKKKESDFDGMTIGKEKNNDINSESYLHFGGCYGVSKVSMNIGKKTSTLQVTAYKNVWQELGDEVAKYQMNRATKAFTSIHLDKGEVLGEMGVKTNVVFE